MAPESAILRLADIVEAIELIQAEMADIELADFARDTRRRWLVERGIEIVSEASRHLPAAMKARHPTIPWRKVAGIGNFLRHEYQRVAHDILFHVVRQELPELERVCRQELARLEGAGQN